MSNTLSDIFRDLPLGITQSAVDMLGGLVRSGGFGGVVELMLPEDIKKNQAVLGIVRSLVTPIFKKLNDTIVDSVTGTSDAAVRMSEFATPSGFAINVQSAQQAYQSRLLRQYQSNQTIASGIRWDTGELTEDYAKRLGAALGYTDTNAAQLLSDSIFGKLGKRMMSSQLDSFIKGTRSTYTELLYTRPGEFGATADTSDPEKYNITDSQRALAGFGASDLAGRLSRDFYGLNSDGRRVFGSLGSADVAQLTAAAAAQIGAPRIGNTELADLVETNKDGKQELTARGRELMTAHNQRIQELVQRLADSVENVRDVLGRQVGVNDALKLLGQLSGTNVVSLDPASLTTLSASLKDAMLRSGYDIKQLSQDLSQGSKFYSQFGIESGISSRLELDRLQNAGKQQSTVLGYTDNELVEDQRRVYANRTASGLLSNIRTAFAAYVGYHNLSPTQERFDEFVTKLRDKNLRLSDLRSTADVRSGLSALGIKYTHEDLERIGVGPDAKATSRIININKPLDDEQRTHIVTGVRDQINERLKGLSDDADYANAVKQLTRNLGAGDDDAATLLTIPFAELSQLLSNPKLARDTRRRLLAIRSAAINKVARDSGVSPEQVEQQINADRQRKILLPSDVGVIKTATGLEGAVQTISDQQGDVTLGQVISSVILGAYSTEVSVASGGAKSDMNTKLVELLGSESGRLDAVLNSKDYTEDQKRRIVGDTIRLAFKKTKNIPVEFVQQTLRILGGPRPGDSPSDLGQFQATIRDRHTANVSAEYLHGRDASTRYHLKDVDSKLISRVDTILSNSDTKTARAALDDLINERADNRSDADEKFLKAVQTKLNKVTPQDVQIANVTTSRVVGTISENIGEIKRQLDRLNATVLNVRIVESA